MPPELRSGCTPETKTSFPAPTSWVMENWTGTRAGLPAWERCVPSARQPAIHKGKEEDASRLDECGMKEGCRPRRRPFVSEHRPNVKKSAGLKSQLRMSVHSGGARQSQGCSQSGANWLRLGLRPL